MAGTRAFGRSTWGWVAGLSLCTGSLLYFLTLEVDAWWLRGLRAALLLLAVVAVTIEMRQLKRAERDQS